VSIFESKVEQKPAPDKAAGTVPFPSYAMTYPPGYEDVVRSFMTPAEARCDNYQPPHMDVANRMPRRRGHGY